ncbi:hypothetical protein SAMN05216553_103186 [Lentzea fradiae]|uniref:DUF6745 domain-containing protein n=1 Tax=Lentzea fradiae TaxID=200378 RepID=A0A1G7NUL4_9PSEU|nr:hypothetical protein [Lentzea fradiae]SDF76890.1 hypothetical protein SAMN05216553_103186 [Lentzea fradiae]
MSAPGGLEARSPELLREEWLGHALSTAPADRPAAENAVARLYAATGRPPPRFVWVDSPLAATKVLPTSKVTRIDRSWQTVGAQIAALLSRLRHPPRRGDWKGDPPRTTLHRVIRDGLVPAINSTMPASPGIGWAGQHDADWLAELRAPRDPLAGAWATLGRSTGWWWPREDVCVLAERPVELHVDENSLPHNDNGPAITFADGSHAHLWHGRPVPRWVVEEPDLVRIMTERRSDVKLCAAERLGWAGYVEQAGPPLLGTAPDPGNPGCELRLYALWEGVNLLAVVNGSAERDGTRRRYWLPVSRWVRDPLSAAASTYGLNASQYAQLRRRT